MKKSSAIFLILASFIGAGFATGKELFIFYARFGFVGVLNIVLTALLLYIVIKYYLNNHNCCCVFENESNIFCKIVKISLTFCYFIVCSALFASINELCFSLTIKTEMCVGVLIATLILVLILSFGDVKNLSKISSVLVPIIILFYVVVCVCGIIKGNFKINNYNYSNNILISVCSGINYVGINTVLSLMLFKNIGINCKQNKRVAIGCAIIFGLLVFLGVYALMCSSINIVISEMPLLVLATSVSKVLGWGYIVGMWFAILTSILTIVYTIKCNLKSIINNNILLTVFAIVPCFVLSFVGFGNLIEYLYPVIGAIGVAYFMVFKIKNSKTIVKI